MMDNKLTKKITVVALATFLSTTTLIASSNVNAASANWLQSGQSFQLMSNPLDWLFGDNNNYQRSSSNSTTNAPAPIPGLLALAAAVGGGIVIRRKSKKNKSDNS